MTKIKERIEKAGSYVTKLAVDSIGLGFVVDDFKNNGRLQKLREEAASRQGLQKVVPLTSYASQMLFCSAMEFTMPSFSRGLVAASRDNEFHSVEGTPEHKNYYRDSIAAFCGIIPDELIFIRLGADFLAGSPEALGIKILYNAGAHIALDILKVPRFCDSLRARSAASKHIPT